MNDCDCETGGTTPIRYPAPRKLRPQTALRAIGMQVLKDRVGYYEAAGRIAEEESAVALRMWGIIDGTLLSTEPLEDQAMYAFFLAAAWEQGDL